MDQYVDCIIFLLAKAYQAAHGRFKKRLLHYGLTPVQHLILEALWHNGEGLAAGDLGKCLVLDSATLSGVLDRMAEGGWIIKRHDEKDKRVVRVYLTEKSQSLKDALLNERRRANEEILKPLRPRDQITLKNMLRELKENSPVD